MSPQLRRFPSCLNVRPTDWAFTSLQSLVERYGCIAGYPDSTFRGGKPLARYEFAAGLNACLDKINEIISTNPQQGLFGGTNTLTAELVYSPSKDSNFRFLYTQSNIKTNNDRIGGAAAEPLPYGFADDGKVGGIKNVTADTFIFNFDWLISKGFGIFGRYSYGSTNIFPLNPVIAGGSVNVNAFQFGLGFPDLFKESALGVLSFVVPYSYTSGRNFLVSGGGDGATQYELEASY